MNKGTIGVTIHVDQIDAKDTYLASSGESRKPWYVAISVAADARLFLSTSVQCRDLIAELEKAEEFLG